MRFKEFLINEQQAYLAQKVGDILTAVQELSNDAPAMGARDLVQYTQQVVNQIRPILHSSWPREEKRHLLTLQKVACNLAKAMKDKGDLPGKISGSAAALEKLVADLGVPINKIMSDDVPPDAGSDKKTVEKPYKDERNKAPQAEPQQPAAASASPESAQGIEASPNAAPPGSTGLDTYAPGLGGNSGPLDAF